MSSVDTAEAAAALTASILGEAASKFGGDPVGDNAVRMLGEMGEGQPDVAPPAEPVASSPPPAATAAPDPDPEPEPDPEPPAAEAEQPAWSFDPVPDDDLDRLLEEPDFDEEAREEVTARFDAGELTEDDDPEALARVRALEKRNEYLEQRLVRSERHKWVEENLRKYPVLKEYAADEVRAFSATSRRAFAREAKALNDRLTGMLRPALEDIAAYKAQAKEAAEREARAKAAEQWGLPHLEPAGSTPAATEQERKLADARERRAPVEERFKILMGGG